MVSQTAVNSTKKDTYDPECSGSPGHRRCFAETLPSSLQEKQCGMDLLEVCLHLYPQGIPRSHWEPLQRKTSLGRYQFGKVFN